MQAIVEKVNKLSFDLRYISDLAISTPGCLRADLGELNFPVAPEIKNTILKTTESASFSYSPTFGEFSLLKAIEKFEAEKLNKIPDSKILVTSGGQAALFAALGALINPGEKILTDQFYYPPYSNLAKLVEGDLIAHDLTDLSGLDTDGIRILLINSPNNPTGKIIERETLKNMAELARKNDWIVIEDSVYDHIYFEEKPVSIVEYCPERTLIINSASKNFCMPGIRIGWIFGPETLITGIAKLHRNMVSCPNSFFQNVLAEFIPVSEPYFAALRTEMKMRRDLTLEIFEGLGWQFIEPKGGIYAMGIIPDLKDGLPFVEKMIREAKVSVMPGKFFGDHPGHIRLCYGAIKEDQILELGKRLRSFVH